MSRVEAPIRLILQVEAGPQADPDQIDRQTRTLIRELRELHIESIEPVRLENPPPGAKAGEAIALGSVVVSVLPSILETVILFLRDWSFRGSDRRVKLRFQVGDRLLEIEYDPMSMTQESLGELIKTLLKDTEPES